MPNYQRPPAVSKNNVIQTTARAALTQASGALFQRLEAVAKAKGPEEVAVLTPGLEDDSELRARQEQIEAVLRGYMGSVLRNVVDNVCLCDEKSRAVVQRVNESPELEPGRREEEIQRELSLIPMRSVPLVNETDDPKYKKIDRKSVV